MIKQSAKTSGATAFFAALALTITSLTINTQFASAQTAHDLVFRPSPADLYDLDHHSAYTWRIDNVGLGANEIVTGAQLIFTNIRNWDNNPNRLFLHLLDTAKNAGVASFIDDPTNSAPVTDITDDFLSARYHSDPKWLVASGTGDTSLTSVTFGTTPTNYIYTFTQVQLDALNTYIANGKNLAIGLDPDCHYFNDGVKLKLTAAPCNIPEPGTFALTGAGLLGIMARRRRW